MKIFSKDFGYGDPIPSRFTGDGENINPTLSISDVPLQAQSLILIVDDPDAPSGVWNHWIVYNISPTITSIKEGEVPSGGIVIKNDFGREEYGGPCPPSGTHRYFFRLFALDSVIEDRTISTRSDIDEYIGLNCIDNADIMGTYIRQY